MTGIKSRLRVRGRDRALPYRNEFEFLEFFKYLYSNSFE